MADNDSNTSPHHDVSSKRLQPNQVHSTQAQGSSTLDLRIELPTEDPTITPSTAKALLHLIQQVAAKEQPEGWRQA